MKLSNKELHTYALEGAKAQLERIYTLFPGLREGGNRNTHSPTSEASTPKRRRRTMSAAQRKQLSVAMKARWAERKAKGAAKGKGKR
jgi:hypothetical protein